MQGLNRCEQQALQRMSALRTCMQGQQQRSCRLRMLQPESPIMQGRLKQSSCWSIQLQAHPSVSHGNGTEYRPAGIDQGSDIRSAAKVVGCS